MKDKKFTRRKIAVILTVFIAACIAFACVFIVPSAQPTHADAPTQSQNSENSTAYSGSAIDLSDMTLEIISDSIHVYNGGAHTVEVSVTDGNGEEVSGENYEVTYENNINAGTATVTATAKEGSGYSGSVSTTFIIAAKFVDVEWVLPEGVTGSRGSYTAEYNGEGYTLTATANTGVEGESMEFTYYIDGEEGLVALTEAGEYNIYIVLSRVVGGQANVSNYVIANFNVTMTIVEAAEPEPDPDPDPDPDPEPDPEPDPGTEISFDYTAPSDLVYDGTAKQATVVPTGNYSGSTATVYYSSTENEVTYASPVNAGTYYVFATVETDDGESEPVLVGNFTITRAVVQIPSDGGEVEANGEEQTYIPEGFDSGTMKISGNVFTEAGNYNATVSLADPSNYVWSDGTDTSKSISFTVTAEQLNLVWLIVLLAVIVVVEVVVIIPLNKRRKRNAEAGGDGPDGAAGAEGGDGQSPSGGSGASLLAVAPLAMLAAENLPDGQLGAIIALGIAVVGLGIADTVLGVKGNKKKAKAAVQEAAVTEPEPVPEPEPQSEPEPEPVQEPEPEPQTEPQLVYDSDAQPAQPEPAYDDGSDRDYATKVLYDSKPQFVPVPAPIFVPVSEPEPEPQPIVPIIPIMPDEDGMYTVRYLYSFRAKLIQSAPEVQQRYQNIIDLVNAYEGVKAVESWRHVRIYSGRTLYSYMVFKGKKLCITFALDPAEFAETKYRGLDVSAVKRYEKTPMMLKLTSDRRGKYSEYLLALLLERAGFTRGETEHNEIYLPYETREQLIRRSLIKIVGGGERGGEKERVDRETFLREQQAMREAEEEIRAEILPLADEQGLVLVRYNYSFRAKLIQAKPELQQRYGELVDFMRSYKNIKAVESWKQVRVYSGRKLYALFTFRGRKLCVSFALDPAEFAETKYRGIDVSGVRKYARTPLMLKLTSERRKRYAAHLFAILMEREGVPQGEVKHSAWEHEYRSREHLIENKMIKMMSVGVVRGAGEAEKVDINTLIRERLAVRRVQWQQEATKEASKEVGAEAPATGTSAEAVTGPAQSQPASEGGAPSEEEPAKA